MKTIKLTILTLLILGNIKIINAQNWLLQGNAIQSTDYLGTNDTNALVFSTNAIERMRITNKGFLGIGTAIPSTKLEIYSPSTFGNLLRVYGKGSDITTQPYLSPFTLATFIQSDINKANAGIRIQGSRTHVDAQDIAFIDLANFDDNNTGAYIMSRIAGGLVDQDPTPGAPPAPALTNDRGYLRFYTNAGILPYGTGEGLVEQMRITDLGLVGIGTPTPQARLNIWESNQNNIAFSITKKVTDNNVNYTNIFEIKKTDATGTTLPVFVVRDTGNVGIGVDVPFDKLHVNGGVIRLDFTDRSPENTNNRLWDCLKIGTAYNSFGNNYSWFQSYTGGEGSLLSLNPVGGNVGIGTDEPTEKLTVAGTVESTTGGFKFPDGTVQTTAATSIGGSNVFDSLQVNNRIKVGTGSLIIDQLVTPTSAENHIYTSSGDLYLQSNSANPTGNVGIGTTNPQAKLHILTEEANNNGTKGIFIESPLLTRKGEMTSLQVTGGVSYTGASVTGTYIGKMGHITNWDLYGQLIGGVYGYVKPSRLSGGSTEYTSLTGGSVCIADLDNILMGSGTWAGGLYAELKGSVNSYPSQGAVAAVIGIDKIKANTTSGSTYAAYFDGKGYFSGNVGIGTDNPYKTLTVNGDVSLANYNISGGGNQGNGFSGLEILGNNQTPTRRGISLDPDPNGSVNFYIHSYQSPAAFNFKDGNGNTTLMSINKHGNVIIGSQTITSGPHTDYKLAVDGKIVAKEFYTTNTGWGDYVFKNDYKLMTLKQVEEHIIKYGHLNGVPSEKEIKENGLNLGEATVIQQVKIEELYLYVIEQQKQIEELNKLVKVLQSKLNE